MIQPNPNDPLKIRRALALSSAIYTIFVLPALLVVTHILWHAETGLLKAILTYIGILASGPIGAYLYAAHKKQP